MDENKKVKITNMLNCRVGITLPDLHYKRELPKKGSFIMMPWSILQEAYYDPGFNFMIQNRIVLIDDEEALIELGLAYKDETTKKIETELKSVYNDSQMLRLLKVAPLAELEDVLKNCSKAQRLDFCDFAIENNISDLQKCDLLKKYGEIDVLNTILLNRKDGE